MINEVIVVGAVQFSFDCLWMFPCFDQPKIERKNKHAKNNKDNVNCIATLQRTAWREHIVNAQQRKIKLKIVTMW